MTDAIPDPTVVAVVGGLFARLGGQLADLATSEQQLAAQLKGGASSVTDPAQKKMLQAAVAERAAFAKQATQLATTMESTQTEVQNDLTTLIAVTSRNP